MIGLLERVNRVLGKDMTFTSLLDTIEQLVEVIENEKTKETNN